METYLNFERNYYDSVRYVLYNYTGEELDESKAKIAAESSIYSPGVTTMGFRESKAEKAGSKLMIADACEKRRKQSGIFQCENR